MFSKGVKERGREQSAGPRPTDFPKLHLALFHKSPKKIILKGEGGPGARLCGIYELLNKHQLA